LMLPWEQLYAAVSRNKVDDVILAIIVIAIVSFCLLSLPLFVSVSVTFSLCLSLCFFVSLGLSVSVSLSLSLCLPLCFFVSLSLSASLCVSLPLSLSACLALSLPLSVFLCLSPALCVSPCLSSLLLSVSVIPTSLWSRPPPLLCLPACPSPGWQWWATWTRGRAPCWGC